MAYDEREKKRKKRRIFRTLFIATIFLYLFFRSVPSLLANNAKTILPEKDILIDKTLTQGFIIKNETIVRADRNGELELFADEGTRLSSGTKVASISSMDEGSSLKQELEQIEKSIIALQKSEADTETMMKDKVKVEDIQENLAIELQKLINKGEFEEVYILKEKLALYNTKAEEVTNTDTLLGQSLEKLKERKETINSKINSNHTNYYTNTGGIISYEIDGYEELYIPKDFENYSYDKLDIGNIKDKDENKRTEVLVNEPIYKTIDNFEWYLVIMIEDPKEIEGYENRDKITIEMKEDREEITGRIVSINNSKNKSAVVAKFNTKFYEYYNQRFPEVYLIKNKVEGFKIPNKAVVDKDSIKGVYIKDASGIVKFRPINIMGEDGKFTYIEIGNNMSQIKLDDMGEPVRTVSIYDEIFINTTNIKEGQILD